MGDVRAPSGGRDEPAKADGSATAGARPLRADARRNRQRVIDAASAAFAGSGIAVSMDEIAERAGVGVGTLYRHFPTKEALFAAVVRHHFELLIERAQALSAAEDPVEALFGFLREMVGEAASKRDVVEALNRAGVDFDSAAGQLKDGLQSALARLVGRAQEAGAIRPDVRPEEVMSLLAGACMATTHLGSGAECRERMVEVICDGLRQGSGRPGARRASGPAR